VFQMRTLAIIAAAVGSFALAGTSGAQESKLKLALTRCLSEGIAAGIQLRSLAGTKNGWMELNCEGPTAEALFAGMELVSEQKLSGPPFVDQINIGQLGDRLLGITIIVI
jgi:hypothetical protein